MTSRFYDKTCGVFSRDFLQIGNIELFESLTIAAVWNKVLGRKCLEPDTIGLIPTGGYICNNKYSRKAIMSLHQMEQTDVVVIKHARNGREYRQPELPHLSVEGYSEETNTFYEFFGCY